MFQHERIQYCIVAHLDPWDDDLTSRVKGRIVDMIGWRYSWLELPLQLFDGMIAKVRRRPRKGYDAVVFRRLGGIWKRGVICSKTGNWPLVKEALMPARLEYASPDDTWDWTVRSQEWRIAEHSPCWMMPAIS
jgi:hypothetical protein